MHNSHVRVVHRTRELVRRSGADVGLGMFNAKLAPVLVMVGVTAAMWGCGDDDKPSGTGGRAGAAGSSGKGGTAGKGGAAGMAGKGGSGGATGGRGGTGGKGGTAGKGG